MALILCDVLAAGFRPVHQDARRYPRPVVTRAIYFGVDRFLTGAGGGSRTRNLSFTKAPLYH